ncbi:MAG TPA: hypothetical protein VMJ10_26295 [Kofleriaceae bacterium]|nr:hypothetical protein [Kofleriaceae bacterium]
MTGRGVVAVALAAAGCGHVGFDRSADTAADGGGDGGGGGGDGMQAAAPLGGLTDNFDSGSLAAFWTPYVDSPSTYQLTGGQLVLDLAANVAGVYVGTQVLTTNDLHEHAATIEAVTSTATNNCGCYLILATTDGSQAVGLVENSGMLEARIGNSNFVTIPYDPVAHLWWQIVEHAGTTTWQASPDGRTWTAFASTATMAFESAIQVNLGGGTQGSTASPGQCIYDNFDLPP